MTNNKLGFFFIAGLVAVAGLGFGCNPVQDLKDKVNDKVSEKVAEGLLGKATDGQVDVGADGESVSFTDNKSGDQVAFGEDVKIPDNFPKTVPIYPGSKANNVSVSNGMNKGALVILNTDDQVSKVLDWYQGEFKDWKENQNMTINGAEFREYEKDGKKIGLSISEDKTSEVKKTTIMLNYAEEIEAPAQE